MALLGAKTGQDIQDEMAQQNVVPGDLTTKKYEFSQTFLDLIKFLNPTINNEPFKPFTLESISDDEVKVLELVLKSTKQPKLGLQIKSINDEQTHRLLEAIAGNQNILEIEIKIPRYDVASVQSLKSYLASLGKDTSEMPDLTDYFSQLMSGARSDLDEFAQAATGALQTTKGYLNSFLAYVAGEEDLAPAQVSSELPTPAAFSSTRPDH